MNKLKTLYQFLNENVSDEEVFSYLNDLRDSGQTNMFGAGSYIEKEFGLDKRKARDLLTKWMKSFDEAKVNESDNWKTVKTKSGDILKPGKKYKMPRYDGEITFIRFDRDNKTLHLKSNKIGKIRTSINNVKDMELIESVNEANGQTIKELGDLLAILTDIHNQTDIELAIKEMDPKKARTLEKQISTLSKSLFKLV